MSSSYLPIIAFVGVTTIYYIGLKPTLKLAYFDSEDNLKAYYSNSNIKLGAYLVAVIASQAAANITAIISACGGSVTSNIGAGFLITFIPWVFIFGTLVCVLIIFPGFKAAFSNVVGYFAVATSATKLLSELLVDINTQTAINNVGGQNDETINLQKAQEAILKLCGNVGILINSIVPQNFETMWAMLTPLIKKSITDEQKNNYKEKLLSLTVTRDNIGEAMWYVYTALLIISITGFKIASRSCTKDLATMQADNQTFLDAQSASEAQTAKAQSTTYTYS